jgi:hypothetical protein
LSLFLLLGSGEMACDLIAPDLGGSVAVLRAEVGIEEEDAALHSGQPIGVEVAVLGVGVGVEKEAAAALEVDLGAVEGARTRRKMTPLCQKRRISAQSASRSVELWRIGFQAESGREREHGIGGGRKRLLSNLSPSLSLRATMAKERMLLPRTR